MKGNNMDSKLEYHKKYNKTYKKKISSKSILDKAFDYQESIYGKKYKEYKKKWNLALNLKYESDFPLYIMLEQTYKCPLRCVSCVQGYPELRQNFDLKKGGNNNTRMDWDTYKKIVGVSEN